MLLCSALEYLLMILSQTPLIDKQIFFPLYFTKKSMHDEVCFLFVLNFSCLTLDAVIACKH